MGDVVHSSLKQMLMTFVTMFSKYQVTEAYIFRFGNCTINILVLYDVNFVLNLSCVIDRIIFVLVLFLHVILNEIYFYMNG